MRGFVFSEDVRWGGSTQTLVTFETTFVISSTEKIYINKERNFERHISVANAK